jgi:hypothetical protein
MGWFNRTAEEEELMKGPITGSRPILPWNQDANIIHNRYMEKFPYDNPPSSNPPRRLNKSVAEKQKAYGVPVGTPYINFPDHNVKVDDPRGTFEATGPMRFAGRQSFGQHHISEPIVSSEPLSSYGPLSTHNRNERRMNEISWVDRYDNIDNGSEWQKWKDSAAGGRR